MNLIAIRQRTEDPYPSLDADGELGTISLRWFLALLLRRRVLIAITAVITASLCFTALLLQRPNYTATALVMIDPGRDRTLQPLQSINGGEVPPNAPVVDSQLEVLRSRMVAGRLVDDLNLAADPEWNPSLQQAAPSAPPSPQTRDEVVDAVAKAIDVRRRGLTYAVEVSVTALTADRAAQMANRLVAVFQQQQMESQLQSVDRASAWLDSRVRELRDDVQQKEAAAERYRAQTGLLSTQGSLLSERQTTEIQGDVMQARADLAEKEARYRQLEQIINSGGSADTIAGVLNSTVIAQLRAQEADIARRQAAMESRYGDMHPAVVNVRAEREDNRNQINAEIARISSSLHSEVQIARARLNTLEGSMSSMRGEIAGDNEELVTLREYEREAAAARAVYETFLQRSKEITDQGLLHSTAELVSAAAPPMLPNKLRLWIAFVLSAALGLGLGIVAGLLAEALEEGFSDADDVENKLGVAALATIPRLSSGELRQLPLADRHPAGYLIKRPISAFTEACRILRTAILFDASRPRSQIVAVTSAAPGEGKTTLSMCLARISAVSGQRVLLIDCDLRRRSATDILNIKPAAGLLQVLAGEVDWRAAIHVDQATGMCVLPLSDSGFISKDVFGAGDMDRLLPLLRESFDMIVLDCAPVLAVAETRVIVGKADCAIIVASWSDTPVRVVRTALKQLQHAGANVQGVALNGVHRRMPGYYSYPIQGQNKA